MSTKTESDAPAQPASRPAERPIDVYRKRLEEARVGKEPRYSKEVIDRKVAIEERRLKEKDPHAKRFQRVNVPNKSKGYDTAYRCRACGVDVAGPDPESHKCEENVETSKRRNRLTADCNS